MRYDKVWFHWGKPTYLADPQNWKELREALSQEQFLTRDPSKGIPEEETNEILNILG